MNVFQTPPKAPPLEGLNLIAAQLLTDLYQRRIQDVIARQVDGRATPELMICFSERLCADLVVDALRSAQRVALHQAVLVAMIASDNAKAGSKEQKTAEAILEELKLLSSENSFAVAT